MTHLGLTMVWCALQVTVVAAVAGVCYSLVRRRGPIIGSTVVVAGLMAIVVLTLMFASPWPRWEPVAWEPSQVAVDASSPLSHEETRAESTAPNAGESSGMGRFIEAFWWELQNQDQQLQGSTTESHVPWTVIAAWIFFVGIALGAMRLLVGVLAVQAYRKKSHPLVDKELSELVDVLCAELQCRRQVVVRESMGLSTAATIGWRRPVILLPEDWRTWSLSERRAVLAHELAHIQHHDYPTWVLAEVSLLMHFYHPLVHWLVSWLRLDQELAADAVAARLSGGSRSYLMTLAELALRQPERPLGWPARCFLPTRRTFLRRIEMLRNRNQLVSATPAGIRATAVATVLLAGLVALGLRPAPAPAVVAAGQATGVEDGSHAAQREGNAKAFALSYIPRDAAAVLALRPASLLVRPSFAPLANVLTDTQGLVDPVAKGLIKIEQCTLAFQLADRPQKAPQLAVTVLQLGSAQAADELMRSLLPEAEEIAFDDQSYMRSKGGGKSVFKAGPQTLVLADDEGRMRRAIVAGQLGARDARWSADWQRIATADMAALVNVRSFAAGLKGRATEGRGAVVGPIGVVAPLWENVSTATLQVDFGDQIKVLAHARAADADKAREVEETLSALLTLGKNSLSQFRRVASQNDLPDTAFQLRSLDLMDRALDQAKIARLDSDVSVTLGMDGATTTQLVKTLVPAVTAARTAARRAMSINNLKQLSLAMLLYHDKHGHFPPAVILGPDGQTPHSWRVALLPYLEAKTLYDQYRFDEPWNSENNKRVLKQMPPVFAHPSESPDQFHTSYHAITGPGTLFPGGEGTKIQDIRDGTSNTIMLVEAKRGVPWTQPVDLSYDPNGDLPQLGGFHPSHFAAAFCDGSVRILTHDLNEQVLRKLITIRDGQPVNLGARP